MVTKEITRLASFKRGDDRPDITCPRLAADNLNAGGIVRYLRDQVGGRRRAGNIDDVQSRPSHLEPVDSWRRAR